MVNKFGLIYKITNISNNKCYIGQTRRKNPNIRINIHFKKNHDSYINRAIKKYGKKNFKVEILFMCLDLNYLNEMEIFFIKKYNSISPSGYNIQTGGYNYKMHKLTKEKIGKSVKEYYKNNSHPLKNKKFSKKHIENLSKSRKGFENKNRKIARKKWVNNKKLNKEYVEIIAINNKTKKEYYFLTIEDCCKYLNLDSTCVSRTLRGVNNRKQHKGYSFKRP